MSNDAFTQFAEQVNDRLTYQLTVFDDENGEEVINLIALSIESLQEQFHKIDSAINKYINEKASEMPDYDDRSDEE